ncbi:hypothetical protein AUEXF2481DRAFT_145055 [Aureobasidium subglaciale EXF-2481]|uniref:Uncharacterized protein n=1 Tax=Aureobasidium subglaciale (strain EXF-2481) TaxID=1043005 RepID=A0A074Z2X8_AURSE|nr:uncharacterized protein AUEXF2481DRAFT_145055 [Aureobasidium subglaciale EXF-2481]KAI5199459.1 hypothetical protein E4T38_07038 [Aureobasidium subglaciale]KAI5218365.1 hypothetical protein E4T40_06969 [Aureobasidium subglaciale]KAI5221945.1 hypothetical protein E4T41_06889 [Aureobasidium subglaciale]KAI5259245.1 hypothetical protein E4T46_06867 [Aureobasidium subglaciale]KER00618.1 hypothetical protein AUEXF2481DRAFT_145055 [Aureobasidium subglaciale EXF-2481]
MLRNSEVYELPGDLPPVAELAGESLSAELPGKDSLNETHDETSQESYNHSITTTPCRNDLLPTPYSAFSTISSNPSLKPSALNFSRPRPVEANSYNFGCQAGPILEYDPNNRPILSESSQTNDDPGHESEGPIEDENADGLRTPAPSYMTYTDSRDDDTPRHSLDGASLGGVSIDEAVPPPIRTYADLRHIQLSRDSIDGVSIEESTPPPTQPLKAFRGFSHDFSTLNISRGDSIYEDFPTPPDLRSPKENFRKASHALPLSIRESDEDTLAASIVQGIHPLSRMDTTSSTASSFDEAAPPPVSTRRYALSHMDTDSSRGTKSSDQTRTSRVDSVVDPSAAAASKSAVRGDVRTEPRAPKVLIYKPYLDYATSQLSDSIRTSTTQDDSCKSQAPYEDRRHSLADSESSSVSDFAFDGQLGWNPRGQKASEKRQQRWTAPLVNPLKLMNSRSKGKEKQQTPLPTMEENPPRQGSNASSHNGLSPTSSKASTGTGSSTSSRPPMIPARIPRIIKRTSLDQMSEHVNPWQGESMSDHGSVSSQEWTSSDVDTSSLSVEKIHKLKKKGINPALYVEMQNARKGKNKWISPLQGNSFIS